MCVVYIWSLFPKNVFLRLNVEVFICVLCIFGAYFQKKQNHLITPPTHKGRRSPPS